MKRILENEPLPPDFAMILRVIDAKFETMNAKLDGLTTTIDALSNRFQTYDTRFQDHEHRIADIEKTMEARKLMIDDYNDQKGVIAKNGKRLDELEKWQTEEQTTTRNLSSWGRAAWAVCGSAVTALVGWLIFSFAQASHENKHPLTQTKARVEVTKTQ